MNMPKRNLRLTYLLMSMLLLHMRTFAQQAAWDAIKADAAPVVTAAFADVFSTPEPVPVVDYGWEDGLQVSYDGLNLYALYAPADLLSWMSYIIANPGLPICNTFGTGAFIRPYAGTYGMDMTTNFFGCDTMINLDIVYAHRNAIDEPFSNWTLSDMARPGLIEGGPFPLFSTTDPESVDHFLFTGPGDIWMINNTTPNPSGIAAAVRLPSPINPVADEFTADNPMLTRLTDGSLLLIYEKYTDPGYRDFMYSISNDDGITWDTPIVINSINNDVGHIEHPMLYFDGAAYWFYYSQNLDIYRARQLVVGDWDSWTDHEMLISKGNTLGIGEPSITSTGDIYFVTVIQNPANPADFLDADPWFVKNMLTDNIVAEQDVAFQIIPNPAMHDCHITFPVKGVYDVRLYDLYGHELITSHIEGAQANVDITNLPPGTYFIEAVDNTGSAAIEQLVIF